tara:strand:- start:388 stop:1560 length:1173 start_codon:yes stop_codon:yes gene_type:complete
MNLNLYGSTGEIGKKTLELITNYYPKIKVNLLCADKNVNLIFKQIKLYKPKFVYLYNNNASNLLKSKIKNKTKNNIKTKVLNFVELSFFLKNTKSDLSILAISGYKSLYFLEDIIFNTNNLGLVNKEAIVSAGHIFKKNGFFKKTNIFPIDSEHFSIFEYFHSLDISKKIQKIILTASGGPFHQHKYQSLKNVSFNRAIKHPKWKMGYKNSIDSATLVNKCLEVIEAHYLFNIPFKKIDVLIHPQAIVHSIIVNNNYVTNYNLFKNDMSIPLLNFLDLSKFKTKKYNNDLNVSYLSKMEFKPITHEIFPIYKFFIKLDKSKPSNLIKFNIGNQLAVDMFRQKIIKYTEIIKIIKKVVSLNLNSPLNNIKDIIKYHESIEDKCKLLFKDIN